MSERYQPLEIEAKWQRVWEEEGDYEIDLQAAIGSKRPKFYAFGMFSYPSGAGIHVGHVKNFTLPDVLLRYRRQKGDLVYAPVGFDAFGLPAENFALKTGTSPQASTAKAIANYVRQYKACGFSFDWSKAIYTNRPDYYRWTQWCFLQLHKDGMAYQKESPQWWCGACQTILADEQVNSAGKCWRHDGPDDPPVSRKSLKQWFFKITDYADEILEATPDLDWTDQVKAAQVNHIGRSEGTEIRFELRGLGLEKEPLVVFTTALDTIYGATFMVLAPEHPLVDKLAGSAGNGAKIAEYAKGAVSKSEVARQQAKVKTGVEVDGLTAVNPLTGAEMPVWVADYVLAGYGTGAIMAVPGADERDMEFAEKYDLPVIWTTKDREFVAYKDIREHPENYLLATDDDLDGLDMAAAKEAIFKKLKSAKIAEKKINYRLRDWLISRQRYWGAPIPIIFCDKCGAVPVREDDLPVELPEIEDYQPAGDGRSPLAKVEEWVKAACPKCSRPGRRETDTMDTYVCSSWYQMRYLSAGDENQAWDPAVAGKWFPVDFYNGADHATAHLLYARFFTRFFNKKGLLPTPEPFSKMYFHAKILSPSGGALSKSKGNVIDPLELIQQGYGADALRVYICSVAPPDLEVTWDHNGVPAAWRFLNRVFTLVDDYLKNKPVKTDDSAAAGSDLLRAAHRCVAKSERDIERLKFNTALAAQMELVNFLYKRAAEDNFADPSWQPCLESLVQVLAPFAPHLASELWQRLGHMDSVNLKHWPEVDQAYLEDATITLPIQVNGRLRGQVDISAAASEETATAAAAAVEPVAKHLSGSTVERVLYVPGKIINFVLKR